MPKDKSELQSEERRTFVKAVGGAAVAAATLTATNAEAGTKTLAVPLDKIPEVKNVGGSAKIKLKGQDVIFVRSSETKVKAFDPTCTHKKCKVKWINEDGNFFCKCHKSKYDPDGTNFDGPAPAPLTKFKSKLKDDKVLVKIPVEE